MAFASKPPATRRRPRRGPLLALPLSIQYAILGGFILGLCLLLVNLRPRLSALVAAPPTATPTPLPPTATFTVTRPPPTATHPPPSPTPGLGPGATAQVGDTGGLGLVMHTDPGLNTAVIRVLQDGERVVIIAGPQQADGMTWWQVRDSGGQEGWVAASFLQQVREP
jgi:hypothetical protein